MKEYTEIIENIEIKYKNKNDIWTAEYINPFTNTVDFIRIYAKRLDTVRNHVRLMIQNQINEIIKGDKK